MNGLYNSAKIYRYFAFFLLISFTGCESAVEPILNTGKEYSVYGPLDMQKTPNYIRVYDTKKLLTPETSQKLDVEVIFTDLATNESQLLEDRVVMFDSIFTHNYRVDMPIEYDHRNKVEWRDSDGFSDSLITVTPKQTVPVVLIDSVECGENFLIHLSDINLDRGEQLLLKTSIKIGDTWFWTPRKQIYTYSPADTSLVIGYNPARLIELIFGLTPVTCDDITSDKILIEFTHIGSMEGFETIPDVDLEEGNISEPQIVLSKYSGETEITLIL